jgi:CRP/FNR family transcriptional regulator, dissimilatory nitrate respiration regulator
MKQQDATLDDLKKIFFFKNWAENDLALLVPRSKVQQYQRGERVFLQEEPCSHLHIQTRGKCELYRIGMGGKETSIHTIGAGGLVGCAALFLERAYPACARAVTNETTLLSIEGRFFLKLLDQRVDLNRKMLATFAARISELADRLESNASRSALQRVGDWLLSQPAKKFPGSKNNIIEISGTKKALAAALVMTPETFSRCLSDLEKQGVITKQGKEITLLDFEALDQITNDE